MKHLFNLAEFTHSNCSIEYTDEHNILIKSEKEGGRIMLSGQKGKVGGTDWKKARYIVLDVVNLESWAMGIALEFWTYMNDSDEPDMKVTMGIVPGLKTRLSFPLAALNSQEMFLKRTPGKLKTVVKGNKVRVDEINRFGIGIFKWPSDQKLRLSNVYLTDVEPEYPLPDKILVDELGQPAYSDWPGKTHSVEEMTAYLTEEAKKPIPKGFFNDDWSRYGGWKNKKFEATGYFRTEHDGRRWWLVDPNGNAFFSSGLDCVRPGEAGYVEDIQKLFAWLPDKEGTYSEAWKIGEIYEGYDFFNFGVANLIRTFGSEWWNNWAKITKRRLLEWGFNTIGNWSSLDFIRYAKLPYVWPLKNFPTTQKKIFRDFPDVFSDEYTRNSAVFAEQLKAFEGDRYMIGYFLRNEPIWGFVDGLNIAEEVLENECELASKDALIMFLSERYGGDINNLNSSWNTDFDSFDDLKKPIRKATSLSAAAEEDLTDFSRIMIERYVKIPSEAVKKVDPYHLNLGMRYAYISSELLYSGCQHFDVFSINCYRLDPYSELERVGKATGMPVMIGEFHFGALDRGIMTNGLVAVNSQEDRAIAFRYYMENAASANHCVGAHYFIMNDQPALGRYDGENCQIGCIDVCQKPYEEFINSVILTNSRLYEVAEGLTEKTHIKTETVERNAI